MSRLFMKTRMRILALVLILTLIAAGLAVANSNTGLSRWVLGSGSSDSSAGDATIRGTIGQPVVGVVTTGNITLGQGFWLGGLLPGSGSDTYLPLIQK